MHEGIRHRFLSIVNRNCASNNNLLTVVEIDLSFNLKCIVRNYFIFLLETIVNDAVVVDKKNLKASEVNWKTTAGSKAIGPETIGRNRCSLTYHHIKNLTPLISRKGLKYISFSFKTISVFFFLPALNYFFCRLSRKERTYPESVELLCTNEHESLFRPLVSMYTNCTGNQSVPLFFFILLIN